MTDFEIDSVAEWCVGKMRSLNINFDNITTHREISPGRKSDVSIQAEKAIKDKILYLFNQFS